MAKTTHRTRETIEADSEVTAYDLGRAYAACHTDTDEDTAVALASLPSRFRADFVRGFRSAD